MTLLISSPLVLVLEVSRYLLCYYFVEKRCFGTMYALIRYLILLEYMIILALYQHIWWFILWKKALCVLLTWRDWQCDTRSHGALCIINALIKSLNLLEYMINSLNFQSRRLNFSKTQWFILVKKILHLLLIWRLWQYDTDDNAHFV